MNQTEGLVVRAEDGRVWIRASGEPSACGACVQKTACGMQQGETGESVVLCLPNRARARVGDRVLIEAAAGAVLHAAAMVYGVPLLLALAGALVGHHMTGSEGVTFTAMLAGLASGAVFLRQRRDAVGPVLSISLKHHS
jgi:sigma-E factor negative regulatory protein RseC